MEIYLIRHTTPAIKKGICYGQADIDITETFLEESKEILTSLPITFDCVFSSPLLRCRKLATQLSPSVIEDSRLQELNFGKWELMPWDNIPKNELQPWMDNFVTEKVPEGESYLDLQQRVVAFYKELFNSNYKKIAIISHAGPIRALLATLQNIPLQDSFSIALAYGQISKIVISDQKISITTPYSLSL